MDRHVSTVDVTQNHPDRDDLNLSPREVIRLDSPKPGSES